MDISLRTLRRDEVDLTLEFAAREGWNPGLHDAVAFHAADPDGFIVAEHLGEVVGCIAAVSYGVRFGFIGLYIVAPGWRGQGIGRQLWAAGMARLAGHVIGLDGVLAQQDNYRRSGFELAWRNQRYAGATAGSLKVETASIVSLAGVDFALLAKEDLRTFPAPREAFLRGWIAMPDATALAWVEHGGLTGWGSIRRCREGYKIGPLVADRPAVADALYTALCQHVPGGEVVYFDVPLPNADAVALAQTHGLRPVFETARMYAGTAPALELQRVYGITTFELG